METKSVPCYTIWESIGFTENCLVRGQNMIELFPSFPHYADWHTFQYNIVFFNLGKIVAIIALKDIRLAA